MTGYSPGARCLFYQKEYPGITIPTGPPNKSLLIIPNLGEEDWKSGKDILQGLIAHPEFRQYLKIKANEMRIVPYSPTYFVHPLLPHLIITLHWGETDDMFLEKLNNYLTFIRACNLQA